jgi:hypothetical protein
MSHDKKVAPEQLAKRITFRMHIATFQTYKMSNSYLFIITSLVGASLFDLGKRKCSISLTPNFFIVTPHKLLSGLFPLYFSSS